MSSRRLCRLALLTIVGVHLVYLIWTPYLNHDAAANVSAAQLLLAGARPGIEIVDVTPPMSVYLSAVPVAIASWLHVSAAAASLLFFFGVNVLGGWLLVRGLGLVRTVDGVSRDLLLALWFLLSLRVYWSVGPLEPLGDFGQRDCVIFAWLLPMVLIRYARYLGRPVPGWLAWLAAACAVIAIGLKPYYVLPLAGVELFFAVSFRRVAPAWSTIDWWLLAGGQTLYGAHFLVFAGPAHFASYWVPRFLRGYPVYSESPRLVWGLFSHEPGAHVWLAGLVLVATHPFWGRSKTVSLPGAFGVFAAVALVIYQLQSKGWGYHRWPFYGAVIVGTAVLAHEALLDAGTSRRRLAATVCACGAVLALAIPPRFWPIAPLAGRLASAPFTFQKNAVAETIEALAPPAGRVLAVSSAVGDLYPALTYTGRLPASRFTAFSFPLAFCFAGSADYAVSPAWQREEAEFYAALVEDVRRNAPRLALLQDARAQSLPPYFRAVEYLRRRGFFATALAGFVGVGQAGDFQVYVRADGPGGVLSAPASQRVETLRQRGILR
jgi:hypothetical protein